MNRFARRALTLAITSILVGCVAQPESDQRAAATPPQPEPKRQERVAETVATTTDLEQIIVTAQKRTQSAQGPRGAPIAHRADKSNVQYAYSPPPAVVSQYQQPTNTEQYQHQDDNPIHLASEQPVSTFSIDVDTGAYANVRRFLNAGQLPPEDAVRVEEMINYFDYEYTPPASRDTPFKVSTEVARAPWNESNLLMRIGIKGFEVPASQRPAANLVFLIDVSGSMQSHDKLPLLKNAFKLLTQQLRKEDRVSMVVYAGSTGVVLEPTAGSEKHKIIDALDRLEAGGSTNGAAGIRQAYELARSAFIDGGINRVVLATDGDFNVGIVNFEDLIDMAERQRASGIAITTLGFGTGNYNDKLMERLADAGNGNYSYVDTLSEARKVLVTELSSTLFTIAKDVKIQVEFNPAQVLEYRLIGYENRKLNREDFNNDKVDAGDIGAGHRVTALYEIVPVGGKGSVDPLRYGGDVKIAAPSDELANVRLRYKKPDSDSSQLLEYPIAKTAVIDAKKTSADFRFAASVAAFGQLLRGGKYIGQYSHDDIAKLAKSALSEDGEGYRREFVSLVKLAASLSPGREQRVGKIAR
jgi:Ca-activated chloride channel family protein